MRNKQYSIAGAVLTGIGVMVWALFFVMWALGEVTRLLIIFKP